MSTQHRSDWASRLVIRMVLLFWIAAFLFLLVTKEYQRFLRPEFGWVIGVGLLILVVLFVVAFRRKRAGCCGHDHGQHGDEIWIHGAVLLLPLLYLGSIGNQSLGSYAFEKRNMNQDLKTYKPSDREMREEKIQLPAGEVAQPDLWQLVQYFDMLEGETIRTRGVVYHDPNLPLDQIVIFRFLMTCCAADAVPVGVLVDASQSDWPEETWLEVEGTVLRYRMAGKEIPLIVPDQIKKIPVADSLYIIR